MSLQIVSRRTSPDPLKGERALAVAVITRAIRDSLSPLKPPSVSGDGTMIDPGMDPLEARSWLLGKGDPGAGVWFELAGVGPFSEEELGRVTMEGLVRIAQQQFRVIKEAEDE